MGGFGSGRQDGRPLVSQFLAVDVNRLNRDGCLEAGWWGSLKWERSSGPGASIALASEAGRVRLTYSVRLGSGTQELVEDMIPIVRIPCRFGGSRPYLVCPGLGDDVVCGRRVVMIYNAGRLFRCRLCHQLAFASQREQPYERALRRVRKVRLRLGGVTNLLTPFPERPERMHWTTYRRLWLRARDAEAMVVEHLTGRLGWLKGTVVRQSQSPRFHSTQHE